MRGSRRPSPHLLESWDRVAARLRACRRVALFLDFDGTLVPIAPHPDRVRVSPATRRVLRRLARHSRVSLVVISGRRRSELRRHIGIRRIRYFGLYGWERSRASSIPASMRATLRRARAQLVNHVSAWPNVWLENKRHTLAVHLQHAPAAEQRAVRRKLRLWLRPFRKSLRLIENRRDIEILPLSMPGKGIAVRQFLSRPAGRNALPVYFGDDLSDEDAFHAARRGVTVHVGSSGRTHARYRLRGPADVAAALRKLEASLK